MVITALAAIAGITITMVCMSLVCFSGVYQQDKQFILHSGRFPKNEEYGHRKENIYRSIKYC